MVNRRMFNCVLLGLCLVTLGESLCKGADPDVPSYPSRFTTYLDPNWTTLVGREGPNQSSAVKKTYHEGQPLKVIRVTTHGQTISKGRLDGRKSSVWFYTADGCWIWSGGTTDPIWNK